MENIGEDRWDRAWRFKSLLDSGATVSFSSDWQVGEMDPLVGVFSAATRAALDGTDAWTPDERVGIDRSLEAYTVHGARAWHAEGELGALRPGMLADLVVWSGDLYAHEHDPAGLLAEHAEVTMVGGRVAHSRGAVADAVGASAAPDPAAGGSGTDPHGHEH